MIRIGIVGIGFMGMMHPEKTRLQSIWKQEIDIGGGSSCLIRTCSVSALAVTRTSLFCTELHGKTWKTAHSLESLESIE